MTDPDRSRAVARAPEAYPSAAPSPEEVARAVAQLVRLMAADSTTGREAPAVDVAAALAGELGLPYERLPAAPGRDNLLIGARDPEVVLCTHLDTVPPFVPPRVSDDVVWGRGACDAKGVAVAMLHALARLTAAGAGARVACLFVVGEESDHAGARAVTASRRLAPRHVVLGEPCGMAPAVAQKGLLKLAVSARGRASHSAYPETGVSAVHHLVDALHRLRHGVMPSDPTLGDTTVNVGEIAGGVAPNVIAPDARASVVIRCAAPVDAVLAAARSLLGAQVEVVELGRAEPIDFDTLGERRPLGVGPAVPFNTDAAHLGPLGARMSLMGPGDMRTAHGPDERLAVKDLADGIERYVHAVLHLL